MRRFGAGNGSVWHRAAAGSPSNPPPPTCTGSLAAPQRCQHPPRPVKHDVADVTLIDAATGLLHLFAFRLPQIRVGWKHCGVHPRRVGLGALAAFGLRWRDQRAYTPISPYEIRCTISAPKGLSTMTIAHTLSLSIPLLKQV
jgi:hypothetical protein